MVTNADANLKFIYLFTYFFIVSFNTAERTEQIPFH